MLFKHSVPGNFYVLGENNETIQVSPKQEEWGSLLTIKIQRESKDRIAPHLSSFIGKMEMLVHGWLSRCQSDSLPDYLCPAAAGRLETQVPRRLCSWDAGPWAGPCQSTVFTRDSDVETSRGNRWPQAVSGNFLRSTEAEVWGLPGKWRNFAHWGSNTVGGNWQVSVAEGFL